MSKERQLINDCKHILLSVYFNDIYDEQKDSLIKYYGIGIFNKADNEIKRSRTYQLIVE